MHKSSPTPLDRDWNDISDFKAAYQDYLGGGAAFQTLSVDDAEWLLEAAFNETNQISSYSDSTLTVAYEEVTPYEIVTSLSPTDEDIVESDELFAAFESALSSASGFSNMLPMSDLELIYDPGDDNFFVHLAVASLSDRWRLPAIAPYVYSAFTGATVVSCGAQWPANWALAYNLSRYYDPAAIGTVASQAGVYVNVNTHTFGDDPFDPSSYIGRNNNDYAGYIWGDPTDGFSTGVGTQCKDDVNSTSDPSMTEYEYWMKNVIIPGEKTSSLKDAFGIDVIAGMTSNQNPNPTGPVWEHHIFTFRTGAFLPQ